MTNGRELPVLGNPDNGRELPVLEHRDNGGELPVLEHRDNRCELPVLNMIKKYFPSYLSGIGTGTLI